MKKFIMFFLLLCIGFTYNANAMGNREEGALIGIGALLLIGNMISTHEDRTVTYYNNYPPNYYQSNEVVYYNTPTVVYREPVVERRIYIENNRYYDRYDRRYDRRDYDRYDRYDRRHYDRDYYRHH